jgi:hypothetical protein
MLRTNQLPLQLSPKHTAGETLLNRWRAYARTDGKIPGALIGKLGEEVKYFISLNKPEAGQGHDLSVKFEQLLPRFDATIDWTLSVYEKGSGERACFAKHPAPCLSPKTACP